MYAYAYACAYDLIENSGTQFCNKFEIQFKINTNYVESRIWHSIDIWKLVTMTNDGH